jgi:hypothetical protein
MTERLFKALKWRMSKVGSFRRHDARNRTSHTNDCKVAEAVFALSLRFVSEAKRVLAALEVRNV